MAKICDDCVYRRPLSWGEQTLCCHYAIDTGKLRNCPVEDCENKLTLEEVMKRLTQEQKQEIIRLRIEENVPVKAIAEKFHLSKSAVFNIISKWKEHGESAISEDEIRNELHDRTISEAADDDHVCYEVTGDTDIEAYISDRNVKEPAPAATEASSEQEDLVDVPADIIPEKAEIVKPVIPEGVWEACCVRIEYLRDLIAEEQAVIDNWVNQIKEIEDFLGNNKEDVDNG